MKKHFTSFVKMRYFTPEAKHLQTMLRKLGTSLNVFHVDFVFADERIPVTSWLQRSIDPQPADFVTYVFDQRPPNENFLIDLGIAVGLGRPTFLIGIGSMSEIPSRVRALYWHHLDPEDTDASALAAALDSFLRGLTSRVGIGPKIIPFLCHRSLDKQHVEPIAARLKGMGYEPWYDSWEILPGDCITDQISKGIKDCTHFIIFLSENTSQSTWLTKELHTALSLALDEGKPKIIPVFLSHKGREAVPTLLRDLRGVEFFSSKFESAFLELLKGIEQKGDYESLRRAGNEKNEYEIKCFSDWDSAKITFALSRAQNQIDILSTNLYWLTKGDPSYWDAIKRSVEHNELLKLRILALNPESAIGYWLSRQLALPVEYYKKELQTGIDVARSFSRKYSSRVEVRLYDDLSLQTFIAIDSEIYVATFSRGVNIPNLPIMRFRTGQRGVDVAFTHHFLSLWSESSLA